LGVEALYEHLSIQATAEAPEIYIYTNQRTPRLDYTCQFIFQHVLNCRYTITNSVETAREASYKINYSALTNIDGLRVVPVDLLFKNSFAPERPKPESLTAQTVIYKQTTSKGEHDLGFDIFAAVFFFISRHEEWQKETTDNHQRFEAEHSWLFANKLLQRPLVDEWIYILKAQLQKNYPHLQFLEKKYRHISTIDVDNLYAYKAKGLVRSIGGALKDMFRGKFELVAERLQVLLGKQKDPFDLYEELCVVAKEHHHLLVFFFLFSNHTSFDRTVKPGHRAYQKITDVLRKNNALVGLHPSYNTFQNEELLAKEVNEWKNITGIQVSFSRQHYLRFDIKTTPQILQKQGISIDFSMGFASKAGFRAGTSHPFHYYNFQTETAERLLFVPFAIMDGAYFVYESPSTELFLKDALVLMEHVKKVNGHFITVAHERSFSNAIFNGFNIAYKKLATYTAS
jgi:hypothetical protein